MSIAALYTHGHCVTGSNHGEAFAKLSNQEKDEDIQSGFFDEETKEFVAKDHSFYLKWLVLIRHGECTDGNNLSDNGRQHLWAIAEHLSHLDFSGYEAYTSPLNRCVQSATILSEKTHLHFDVSQDIREQEASEPIESFCQRIKMVIDHLPNKSLLITHSDFIFHLAYIATGESLNLVIPPSSITIIHDNKIICIGQNCDILEKDKNVYY